MADEIVIATSSDRIPLTEDEATKLLAHIDRDGGPQRERAAQPLMAAIAEDGRVEMSWTEESKRITLETIGQWLDTEGAWDVPGSVMDLRYELMRDLKRWPFDSD